MATAAPTMKLMKPVKTSAAAAPLAGAQAVTETAAEPEATTAAAVVAKKAAAKTAPKAAPKKAAAPAAAEAAEEGVVEDLIAATAAELEKLTEKSAVAMVPKLIDNIEHDYFKLGGVLASIQANGWFQDEGYENFRAFIEAKCDIAYRKAVYLISIYQSLVSCGVAWDQVKHLGWTKLKELANVLSPENAADWIALAANCTTIELIEQIKAATKGAKEGESPAGAGGDDAKKVTTMTFKLHEDQKATVREALDKAKHELNTDVDTVALEHIAIDFIGGESVLKNQGSLQSHMESASIEEVLTLMQTIFPTIVIRAEAFETAEEAAARYEELAAEAAAAEEAAA